MRTSHQHAQATMIVTKNVEKFEINWPNAMREKVSQFLSSSNSFWISESCSHLYVLLSLFFGTFVFENIYSKRNPCCGTTTIKPFISKQVGVG
jgi:hypothetical protein